MIFKKYLGILLIILCCTLVLVGCENGDSVSKAEYTDTYIEQKAEMNKIGSYLKLAYSVTTDKDFEKLKEESKCLLASDVYKERIENFYFPKNMQWNVQIESKGYSMKAQEYHYNIHIVDKKNSMAYYVDCFVNVDKGKIVELWGY